MPIRFACPECKTTYTANDRDAGKKSDCKVCGQRLEVPKPVERSKTVLGEVIGESAPATSLSPPRPAAAPPPRVASPVSDPAPERDVGEASDRTPRRMSPHARAGLLAVLIAAGGFLAFCLLVGVIILCNRASGPSNRVASAFDDRPTEKAEGETWTHKELADYLRSKGVKPLWVIPSDHQARTAWLVLDKPDASGAGNIDLVGYDYRGCRVTLTDTAQAAREAVGRHADDPRFFAWGRFTFEANAPVIARIRAALTGSV